MVLSPGISMKTRYLPMFAKSADAPFNGDDWLFEIKWDGIRAIAYIGKEISLKSRNGREIIGQFPELKELAGLAPNTVLDGEIIAMRGGKPDIQEILPRLQAGNRNFPSARGHPPATYIVFDILEVDGNPVISLPLTERREILKRRVREGGHVVLSVPIEGRGKDYYLAAVKRGLEGVVAKRKNSLYEPGTRSPGWIKIKALKTCDCVIAGYTSGEGGRSSRFGALILGLYDNSGPSPGNGTLGSERKGGTARLIYAGKAGSGFSDSALSALMDTFVGTTTATPQITGIEHPGNIIWVEPRFVCEVMYQGLTHGRKLRMPRFIRIRSDKTPEECTIDQLTDISTRVTERGRSAENTAAVAVPQAGEENLKKYRSKRNFSVTDEPAGGLSMTGEGNYFVIHEHHARQLHYDLRLERDGVLKSWAVPRGLPEHPGEKHLAVAVEDHPLDYGHFEGTIPQGEYGAGTVSIWDNGTYKVKHWDENKIEVTLQGKRLDGPYVLVRFKRAGKDEWLIFKAGV
jgi:bifunctional non-homologous end joining protein LigD